LWDQNENMKLNKGPNDLISLPLNIIVRPDSNNSKKKKVIFGGLKYKQILNLIFKVIISKISFTFNWCSHIRSFHRKLKEEKW